MFFYYLITSDVRLTLLWSGVSQRAAYGLAEDCADFLQAVTKRRE